MAGNALQKVTVRVRGIRLRTAAKYAGTIIRPSKNDNNYNREHNDT